MFAISCIVKKRDGSHELVRGSFYNAPPELTSGHRLSKLLAIDASGWSSHEFGYQAYSKLDFSGDILIFPGLMVDGAKVTKKFGDYQKKFSKQQIEEFVDGIIKLEEAAFNSAVQDVNMLIHDLRRISNSIYNSAQEAQNLIDEGLVGEARARVVNVIASQHMLKIRTDVLDFTGNPQAIPASEPFSPYRKVDKVSRSFKPAAAKRDISIDFGGQSFSRAFGPDFFEIVPYILLDNAIKYSPAAGAIDIKVYDSDDSILTSIRSFGPQVRLDEAQKIFQKGGRADAAKSRNVTGSGFGLFLARDMLEKHFRGELSMSQSVQPTVILGAEYFATQFVAKVPIYQES